MINKQEKKKVLVYLTGMAKSPFFDNEISSLIHYFDRIYVITYGDLSGTVKEIENKYNITINTIRLGIKSFIYAPAIVGTLFDSRIQEELNYIFARYHGKTKILCVGYALYYITFAVSIKKRLKEILGDNEKDDIYLYSFWMSKAAFSLVMLNHEKYRNIQLIASRAHGYDVYEERNNANYLPFRKLIAERMDKIFFVSNEGKKYFQQYLKERCIRPNTLDVIHMGVDNSDYIKKFQEKDEMVIVSCSSVIKIKRLDIIIDFVQIIHSKIKVRWLHIGDGNLMKEMKSIADRKLLNSQFEFLGNIDNKKVLSIYRENDVDFFINMSDSEGIPVSIMEAFSLGIPVIARDVGGIHEVVNESNGFIVKAMDKKSLENVAEKVIECFKNVEHYSNLSKNAVDMQRRNFNREINNLKLVRAIIET